MGKKIREKIGWKEGGTESKGKGTKRENEEKSPLMFENNLNCLHIERVSISLMPAKHML